MEREAILCFILGLLIGCVTCMTETIDQYIIGGSEAPVFRSDNHVCLIVSRKNGDPICHGAFLQNPEGGDSQFVLTTASCMQDLAADNISVVLGLYDRSNNTVAQPETITVTTIFKYPYWTDSAVLGYPNDLAVLTLGKVPFENIFIDDILVPSYPVDYTKSECWMMGWGTATNPEGNWENKLQYANMTIMEHEDCVYAWKNMADITSGHICGIGESQDVSACTGDSGASLHCIGDSGNLELAGIASWVRTGCDSSFPTVFTQVPWYGAWINCVLINDGTEEGPADCLPSRNCPCDTIACPCDASVCTCDTEACVESCAPYN